MPKTPPTTSSGSPSFSESTSTDLLIRQSNGASISSDLLAGNQLHELAEQVGAFELREDVPLCLIEGSSSNDSSDESNISRGIACSKTPSSPVTPPPTNAAEGLVGAPASPRGAASIDGHLEMSEMAAAIADIPMASAGPGTFLRPESPAVRNNTSQRRESRRRSSSHTNTAPHNVKDEEDPNDPFRDLTFQQALFDARRWMAELTDVLSNSSIHDESNSPMRRFQEEARNLAGFQCPSTRTVGFVGDSGAGKSSLLNSLLDFKGLARASGGGGACTCIVTEYHYHSTNNFAIEVEWFGMEEITAQLTELLQSYRRYHLRRADIDNQELGAFKTRAKVAECTFKAMCKGRVEDEVFFLDEPEDTALEILQSWAADVLPASTAQREVYGTLEDCSQILMPLTSEQDSNQEPAKWPYIRKVKVFSNAYILSKGLVLADLPGLHDLNSARRNITERYLLQCYEVFAVSRISRAKTDVSILSVFELARQAELSKVEIICTKSDDIKPEEAKIDWGGERANIIQQFLDVIATIRKESESIDVQRKDLQDDYVILSPEEKEDLAEFVRRSDEVKKQKEEQEFKLKQYLITTRNANIIHNLHNMYRDNVPGNDLKVFCVSNHDYWEHRGLPKERALPFLHLSGIFTVRRHCISLVADSQRHDTIKYINDYIPAFLGDVELWVQSGAGSQETERKERIRQKLDIVEARLKRELKGNSCRISTIARSFREIFIEKIFARQSTSTWAQAASDACNEWQGWASATYSAFCRQYGTHETEWTKIRHCWNEEAIEQMVRDLTVPWHDLKSTLNSRLAEESKVIEELMDWAIHYIDTQLQESPESATTLSKTMVSRKNLLLANVEKACEKFQEDLSILRTDALSGIRTSFIGQLMEESYKKCNLDGGNRSDMRRKRIIKERFGDEAVFEKLQINFKNGFRTLTESLQSDIQAAIATNLSVIINTLNLARNENVALESERDPEFRLRVERELKAVMREIRRLQALISS